YRVWTEKAYLAPAHNCSQSQLELNYTDRFSYPLGAFSKVDQRMVGCGRLVRGPGYENTASLPLLIQLVAERNDPCLTAAFAAPLGCHHLFDLLESFEEFKTYFQRLVTSAETRAEVSRVIVDPRERHSGLGEVIVDSLISEAQRMAIEVLFLACVAEHANFYGLS